MNPNRLIRSSRLCRLVSAIAIPLVACFAGCVTTSAAYRNQRVFERPDDAAMCLSVAVNQGNSADIEAIFGSEARQTLSSGDPVADRWNRQILSAAMNERWAFERTDRSTRELVVGHEAWPFPIPLVKDSRGWWFDTAAGREEIWARRIGRNELATIETLRAYGAAQREYALLGRDGKPAGVYAQQIRSDPGKHNGLYWPVSGVKEPPSPFGAFVAGATAEGYATQSKEGSAPYHGYYFRILRSQGPAAPGGARDYVVDGVMTGGFAMIAYPAEYRNSGVMTFVVGPDGVVYQADLGDGTPAAANGIVAYNPGQGWRAVD
jgi:hypothetical protein